LIITDRTGKNQNNGAGASLGGVADLPCLYSNNSTENTENCTILDACMDSKTGTLTLKILDKSTGEILEKESQGTNRLSSSQKKSSISLAWNIEAETEKHGISRLGFLTLTFRDNVTLMSEAQKRFNSLNSHFLKSHYKSYVAVKERTKKGRIHFHLVVVLDEDIRTGFDFDAVSRRDYSSANARLKKEWSLLRSVCKKYGFGRSELLPIKSTAEGISRYVGKYISKNVQQRPDEDKGSRLVNKSANFGISNTRFSMVNKGGRNWRHKCEIFAKKQSAYYGKEINMQNISDVLGKRWAYKYRDIILSYPDFYDFVGVKIFDSISTDIKKEFEQISEKMERGRAEDFANLRDKV
jgi:hypothetical protein